MKYFTRHAGCRPVGRGPLLAALATFLLGSSFAPASTIGTLSVSFARTVTKSRSVEMVTGTIYYSHPDLVLLHVDSSAFKRRPAGRAEETDLTGLLTPMNQWMKFQDSAMLIYYPDEAKAFDVRSRYPFMLPFFQAFVGIVREDFGLAEAGFTLDRSENIGDTLVMHWLPPKAARSELREIRLGLVDNRLAVAETRNSKNKTIVRTTYSDYAEYDGEWFPMSVASFEYRNKETIGEQVTYGEPELNFELPDSITNFELPVGTDVKTIQW